MARLSFSCIPKIPQVIKYLSLLLCCPQKDEKLITSQRNISPLPFTFLTQLFEFILCGPCDRHYESQRWVGLVSQHQSTFPASVEAAPLSLCDIVWYCHYVIQASPWVNGLYLINLEWWQSITKEGKESSTTEAPGPTLCCMVPAQAFCCYDDRHQSLQHIPLTLFPECSGTIQTQGHWVGLRIPNFQALSLYQFIYAFYFNTWKYSSIYLLFFAVMDHSCWKGSWVLEDFCTPFTYPEGPPYQVSEGLLSLFFQNRGLPEKAHNIPSFQWKTWFNSPWVTDDLIICKSVFLTLQGQPCST